MSRSDTIIILLDELEDIRRGLSPHRQKIELIDQVTGRIDDLLKRYRPEYPSRKNGKKKTQG